MATSLRSLKLKLQVGLFRAIIGVAEKIQPDDNFGSRLARGEIVRKAFVDAGAALRRDDRFEEADRMVERGLAAYPGDRTLLFEHAMNAHNSGRYALAIGRWTLALKAAPDLPMCHAGLAANLRATGSFDEAQRVIDQARRTFPEDLTVLSEAARIADKRMRFEDALLLWRRAAATPNAPSEWHQGEAHALVLLGRFEEAEATLHRSRLVFPEDRGLMAVEGVLASARQDWPLAVALWTAYRKRFPDDKTGWENLGRAVEAHQLDGFDVSRERAPPEPEPLSGDEMRDLMLGFESIGDNCEFGSVQRRFGAEPLGLLRWNNVTLEGLLPALAQRFAGMGEPENTALTVGSNGEYLLDDRRWGLGMHTFLFTSQEEHGALFARMCRRAAYLRDKLLADLAAADKTFVFRTPGLDGDQIESLHRALQTFGPVRLLMVQPAAPTAPTHFQGGAGDVIEVDKRRYVGFLERLGVHEGAYWDIAFEDWLSVCRKMRALAC